MQISLDYAKANRQANSLEQCADDMMQQSREVANIIADIRRVWKGDTSNAYIRKLEVLEKELSANSAKCRSDAAEFKARIQAIKKADEDVKKVIE